MKPLNFVLNPDLKASEGFHEKLLNLWEAIKFGIIGYSLFLLLLFADHMLSTFYDYDSIIKDTSDKFVSPRSGMSKTKLILIGIVLIPFIEEMAFRSFMNFKKIYVSMSLGFFSYTILATFISFPFNQVNNRILTICIAVSILIAALAIINNHFLFQVKKNYGLLFYSSNILFMLLHVSNYKVKEFDLSNYFILPIVLMPQLIASFNFSYIRIKNGLLWSILFHSFYNCMFYMPFLIK